MNDFFFFSIYGLFLRFDGVKFRCVFIFIFKDFVLTIITGPTENFIGSNIVVIILYCKQLGLIGKFCISSYILLWIFSLSFERIGWIFKRVISLLIKNAHFLMQNFLAKFHKIYRNVNKIYMKRVTLKSKKIISKFTELWISTANKFLLHITER